MNTVSFMDFEQRVSIKLQKSVKESDKMLKSVYGDDMVTLKTSMSEMSQLKTTNGRDSF